MQADKVKFDKILAQYCGPALTGIKPSNMINIRKKEFSFFKNLLKYYNSKMNKHDIYFTILKETDTSCLLMVYRRTILTTHLMMTNITEILRDVGYPVENDIDMFICHLRKRFVENNGATHEIGYFLGYPLEDVIGFTKHKGKNFLISKYWKVYSNVKEAEKIFNRYDRCKSSIFRHILNGNTIVDMFAKKAA